MNKIVVSSFLWMFFIYSSHADTSVWKISKGTHHLYLGGTVHVLSASDYPLPEPFERAYKLSERLVFETDMQKLKGAEFQQLLLQELTYKNGATIKDVLSAQTYLKLKDYCDSRGISLGDIHSFKPGMLSIVLLFVELQRLGMAGIGVDEFFDSRAREDGKPVGELESAREQIKFLADMGRGKEDEFIEYTLSEMDELSSLMVSIKNAWRSGNRRELKRIGMAPYLEKFPAIMDTLLTVRNNNWMPIIESMFKSSEVEFVLVGALHLIGEQGLLAQLESRGYTIEQQ